MRANNYRKGYRSVKMNTILKLKLNKQSVWCQSLKKSEGGSTSKESWTTNWRMTLPVTFDK